MPHLSKHIELCKAPSRARKLPSMYAYLVKRLLHLLFTLFVVSFLIFFIMHLLPGNPVISLLGDAYDAAFARLLDHEYGFADSFWVRYVRWLGHIIQGDWGVSMLNGRPVLQDILWYLPISAEIIGAALLIACLIAFPAGIIAAIRHNTWADYAAMTTAVAGVSTPDFFLGMLFLFFFTFWCHWLPSSGWVPLSQDVGEHFRHLLMPALTLGVTQAAILARLLRGALLEIIRTEYITTARAKGVYEWWVIVKHALRNALIPIVTMLGLQLGLLLSSAVVVETFFAVPGLGRYGMEAIVERDYPKIQGFILFIALVITTTNLIVDLLYVLLDPRIRYSSER